VAEEPEYVECAEKGEHGVRILNIYLDKGIVKAPAKRQMPQPRSLAVIVKK